MSVEIEPATVRAIVAWVRGEAENKDFAAACEWRNVADAIEREAEDEHWECTDCACINRDDEAFCFRCGAGQPETQLSGDVAPPRSTAENAGMNQQEGTS